MSNTKRLLAGIIGAAAGAFAFYAVRNMLKARRYALPKPDDFIPQADETLVSAAEDLPAAITENDSVPDNTLGHIRDSGQRHTPVSIYERAADPEPDMFRDVRPSANGDYIILKATNKPICPVCWVNTGVPVRIHGQPDGLYYCNVCKTTHIFDRGLHQRQTLGMTV